MANAILIPGKEKRVYGGHPWVFRSDIARVEGDFTPGGRSAAQLKDLNSAMDLAGQMALDLPLSQSVQAAFRDLVEARQGADLDHSAYFLWLSQKGQAEG